MTRQPLSAEERDERHLSWPEDRHRLELALAALEGFMGWAATREPAIDAREEAYQRELQRLRCVPPRWRKSA